jgi:hypothetical protein
MVDDFEITSGPVRVPSDRDAHLFRLGYRRGEVEREVFVYISGTAMASDPATLPSPIGAFVTTQGQAAVEERLALGHNPKTIRADASGSIWEDPAD